MTPDIVYGKVTLFSYPDAVAGGGITLLEPEGPAVPELAQVTGTGCCGLVDWDMAGQ